MDDPTPAELAAMQSATAKKGPPPPKNKKKAEKMLLSDFLDLTTARAEGMGPSSGLGGGFRYGGDRGAPMMREEIPLPDAPPYTAFIGNLSFDLTETDISEFFGGESVVSNVRIVMDTFENKPKGFGYVEFKTKEDLQHSLGATGQSLGNRSIRVTVAEPPKSRGDRGGFDRDGPPGRRMFDDAGRDEGRSMGDWTRSGPLPPLEGARAAPRTSIPSVRSASFEREPGPDVDWSAARGSRFQPTQERIPSLGASRDRSSFDRGAPPEALPSKADNETMWRRPSNPSHSPSGGSPAGSTPASPGGPRRKLELAPRTISASSSQDAPTSSAKPSPFGGAAPVNTAERERQIEEKLAASRSLSRNVSGHEPSGSEAGPRSSLTRSTSGTRVDPFGSAKPVDSAAKEREIEEKLAAKSPQTPSEATFPTASPASPQRRVPSSQGMRKEGFSYSKAATTNGDPAPSNQFDKLTVEETVDED